MPITKFQQQIFSTIARFRNPDSYVAGGTAINRDAESPRFSQDIDIFHDTDEAVISCYRQDSQALINAGYELEAVIEQRGFFRLIVSKGQQNMKLEWLRDTSFRFFPAVKDPVFGYRLHDCDLAINKLIALVNRIEVRDAIDLLHIDSHVLTLAACCWAACGKDPGFTPELIFDLVQRHCVFTPDLLAVENLRYPLDPVKLKRDINAMIRNARKILADFPVGDLGCLYLDGNGNPVSAPQPDQISQYRKHFGSVMGSWPSVAP